VPDVGTEFAGYRIEGVVGRGGMGVVYRATELALNRPVALKVITPELADDDSFRERFLRESRLAASIDHAGILPIYAAGEADGELYLASRFVAGPDLRSLLDDRPLPHERAISLVGQVADALDAAHERGLVHRDVKPGNVLVDTADHCYLCDFGLTKQLGDGATTGSGRLAGSLDYLAPEQIRTGDVDGRADQYALACVLYELLSGRPPFRRETEAQTLWAHVQEEPAPLLAYAELDPIFTRALAKDPEKRYEDCNAFADDARAALGLEPSPIVVRRRRRRIGGRLLAVGAALVAATGFAAGVLAWVDDSTDSGRRAPANSVAIVDEQAAHVSTYAPTGTRPVLVVLVDGSAWIANAEDGTVTQVSIETRRVVRTIGIGYEPTGLAGADRAVWVVGGYDHQLSRIDTSDGRIRLRVEFQERLGPLPAGYERGSAGVATSSDAVWVSHGVELTRFDPRTGAVEQTTRAGGPWASQIAVGESLVWVARTGAFTASGKLRSAPAIDVVDANDGALRGRISLVGAATDIAVGEGYAWIAIDIGDTVWRIDPTRLAVDLTMPAGDEPVSVAIDHVVWVSNQSDATVTSLDPRTGTKTDVVPIGHTLEGIAASEGDLWVAVRAP
jgi:Protein kinase domain